MKKFIVILLTVFVLTGLIFSAGYAGEWGESDVENEEVPYFLDFSMNFDIAREEIKNFAEEHGWEKTQELAAGAARIYYEEEGGIPSGRSITGLLWTPTLVWTDIMHEADIYLKSREQAEEEFEEFGNILKANTYFTVNIASYSEEEVILDNLDFVLENEAGERWRGESAEVSSRGIETREALGITVYRNTIDIFFSPFGLEDEKHEELTLHVISDKPRERVELSWNIETKAPESKIDREEAAEIIYNHPRIKNKIEDLEEKGADIRLSLEEETEGFYQFWLFEDQEAHTTTVNRYRVDRETGRVYILDIVEAEYKKLPQEYSLEEFTERLAYNFTEHKDAVDAIKISPEGKLVASGSYDESIKVWNIDDGEVITDFYGHYSWEPVVSLAFSPDGTRLVSGSGDIKVWEADTGRILHEFYSPHPYIWSVDFSSQGNKIAFSSKEVEIWDLNTEKRLITFDEHEDDIWMVKFAKEDNKIVSSGRMAKVWNIHSGDVLTNFRGHEDEVGAIDISPDNSEVATGSLDETVKVWNIDTGELITDFTQHSEQISSVKFSTEGENIISGSWDGTVKVWDKNTGEVLFSLNHGGEIWALDATPKESKILSGDSKGEIKVWE